MSTNNNEDVTLCHHYQDADKEFVFVYKSQPFATSVLSSGTAPNNTLIDASLVKEFKLKMSDYKCQRFNFMGQKLRCLGKVSTFVQYVKDGMPLGQFLYSAIVVRGLTNCLDVEAIAGAKLVSHLTGSPVDTKGTPSPKRKKAKTSPKQKNMERKCEEDAAPSVPAVVPGVQPATPARSVPAAVPGIEAVNRPEVSHVDPSPPPLTPRRHNQPPPPPSPPGFPTPKFPRPNLCVVHSPPRFPVKVQQLQLSPLSSNIHVLDDEYWGADEKPYHEEMRTLETNGNQDSRYFHCQLDELDNREFAFTKVTAMDVAYDYWSGHGRNKCSPECLNEEGHLPNNCGFHSQFKFPAGFKICSEKCRGAFCVCLRSYH